MWGYTEKMASNKWPKKQPIKTSNLRADSDLGLLASKPWEMTVKSKTPRLGYFIIFLNQQLEMVRPDTSLLLLILHSLASQEQVWLRDESFASNFLGPPNLVVLSEQKAKKSLFWIHLWRQKRVDYRFCFAVIFSRNPKYKRIILKDGLYEFCKVKK